MTNAKRTNARLTFRWIIVLRILAVSILLTACTLLLSTAIDVHYPYCSLTGYLQPPQIDSPREFEISDAHAPLLSWSYPLDCQPGNYRIEISNSPYASDCFYGDWDGDEWLLISETVGSDTNWSPASGLEPLTMYHWRVAAIINGVIGEYSQVECFFTGPACASSSLVAPIPLGPEDDVTIQRDYVVLTWSYPQECLPENYRAELSTDPAFEKVNLMDTSNAFEVAPFTRQISQVPLQDCTRYYWRVTARVGSTWSPSSITRTFSTDFEGACPH